MPSANVLGLHWERKYAVLEHFQITKYNTTMWTEIKKKTSRVWVIFQHYFQDPQELEDINQNLYSCLLKYVISQTKVRLLDSKLAFRLILFSLSVNYQYLQKQYTYNALVDCECCICQSTEKRK